MNDEQKRIRKLVEREAAKGKLQVLLLHREAARAASPIYQEMYAGNQQAGNAAATFKREGGYLKYEAQRRAAGARFLVRRGDTYIAGPPLKDGPCR